MGIAELFEVGFFTAFWNWSNPILTALVYFCVVVGAVLQIVFRKKCRNPIAKWLLIGLCGVGIIISECAWHTITGWERLGVIIIYGFIVCVMLGSILVSLFSVFKKMIDRGV